MLNVENQRRALSVCSKGVHGAAASSALLAIAVAGCTGNIIPPTQPGQPTDPSGAILGACPAIPSAPITIQACDTLAPGLILTGPTLACGGDGKMHVAL